MSRDRFGYGNEERSSGTVGMFDGRNQKDHATIWGKFVQPYNKDFGLEEFNIFMQSSIPEKEKILQQYAGDTDDALWRSKEWMRISDVRRKQ